MSEAGAQSGFERLRDEVGKVIVGQDEMKRAMILTAIDPGIGGAGEGVDVRGPDLGVPSEGSDPVVLIVDGDEQNVRPILIRHRLASADTAGQYHGHANHPANDHANLGRPNCADLLNSDASNVFVR